MLYPLVKNLVENKEKEARKARWADEDDEKTSPSSPVSKVRGLDQAGPPNFIATNRELVSKFETIKAIRKDW